ncbi:acylglycerol kinase, mitochondrial isoform X2 [Cydia fagiglandana]|uniref:acylglycerol kinase, mitochondrial isoform X2 n=1 Tax=Cydia fagiglandana TaxID=1458189 RepID=UPI002FEDF629
MEKIVKFSTTIRNNWKKSVVGACALAYGASVAKEKYDINILMRAACKEAALYGDALIPMERNPTVVTVILNPVANKRSAKKDFEKYCEPLLHLAGLQVDVVQTASEGNAKEIVETLKGLLRRNDEANRFPLGVLPLGRTNKLGNSLFPGGSDNVEKVKQLIDASMAIIRGKTEWKDALKIEQITDGEETPRPIFAMSSIEWGAFRDTMAKKDKYWFTAGLREYATFLFNGYKDSITWNCSGTLKYTPPCAGCANCVQKKPEPKKKWSFFIPSTQAANVGPKEINPECIKTEELCFKTAEFKIETPAEKQEKPSLKIILGKSSYSYAQFVSEGWDRLKNKPEGKEVISARTVELLPQDPGKEVTIEIDKEEFELKPVKVTILPKIVKLFCL